MGAALLAATGASAQAAPDVTAAMGTPTAAPIADGDIVVTAQRREQRLQDVPIAVSAFSQESLNQSGVSSVTELTQVTPSLNFTQTANFAQPTIRGVGTFNTHVGDEANVATYIDGVYISQMLGNFYRLNNIERIEVLKGPQGTLFGRNATGGAINITTRQPSDKTEMKAQISYGRFNDVDVSTFVNGGISEGISANFSASYNSRDGYFRNIVTGDDKYGGRDSYSLRGKLRFEPSDIVNLTLIGDISRSSDPFGILTHTLNRNSQAETLGINTGSRDYDVAFPKQVFNIVRQRGVSIQADITLDLFDIISVTAYRKTDQHSNVDSDGTSANLLFFDQTSRIRDVSQEIRLVSKPGGPIQWIVGAFYYDSSARYAPLIVSAGAANATVFALTTNEKTRAYAGFADITWDVSDQLSLTGGIRYSDETKEFTFVRTPALAARPNGRQPNAKFNAWTPRAVLSYKPIEEILAYASYSKGFKTGGYNTSSPADAPYKPEKLDAYEIGVKSTLAPRTTLNIAAFHYDYRDLQVQALAPGAGTATVSNAATAKMNGLDAELNARVSSALTLRAGLSYLDAKYDRFATSGIFIPRVAGVPGTGNRVCVNASATGGANECDVSGNQIARAPKFTISGGGSYTAEIGSSKLIFSGNVFHSSNVPWEASGRLRQKAYELVNAQVEYVFPGDNLSLTLWGRNLTNERVFAYVAVNGAGDRVQFSDPVTYGGTLRLNF